MRCVNSISKHTKWAAAVVVVVVVVVGVSGAAVVGCIIAGSVADTTMASGVGAAAAPAPSR
jgi:hypothetical protein